MSRNGCTQELGWTFCRSKPAQRQRLQTSHKITRSLQRFHLEGYHRKLLSCWEEWAKLDKRLSFSSLGKKCGKGTLIPNPLSQSWANKWASRPSWKSDSPLDWWRCFYHLSLSRLRIQTHSSNSQLFSQTYYFGFQIVLLGRMWHFQSVLYVFQIHDDQHCSQRSRCHWSNQDCFTFLLTPLCSPCFNHSQYSCFATLLEGH